MTAQAIVDLALINLQKNTQIKGKWQGFEKNGLGGTIEFNIDDKKVKCLIAIKKEPRGNDLEKIIKQNQDGEPVMLVAAHFFPKLKEELRNNNVAYLEANGNIFLKNNDVTLWIDTDKTIPLSKKNESRAFTKTGLKIVFQFLLDETWLNKPYRQIAEQMGTGIGNVTNIINGLKQDDFLLTTGKKEYKLNNKKKILDKWITAYEQKLKPLLNLGTYRFLKENDFKNWKNMPLHKGETMWGGEPAGDLLTDYLIPAELTLYTDETRNSLIKNYRLVPDEKGNVNVYQKFWLDKEEELNVVPPLLVYTDLINTNDKRCIETAQKVYEQYLQNKF